MTALVTLCNPQESYCTFVNTQVGTVGGHVKHGHVRESGGGHGDAWQLFKLSLMISNGLRLLNMDRNMP